MKKFVQDGDHLARVYMYLGPDVDAILKIKNDEIQSLKEKNSDLQGRLGIAGQRENGRDGLGHESRPTGAFQL